MDEGMKIALEEARLAFGEGEVPVGACLMEDGVVLSRAHNRREANLDISSHAEIEAMRQGALALGRWDLSGCALYVTLEPCLMCLGAIFQSRLSTLVFGADDVQEGGFSAYRLSPKERLLVYRGEGKDESIALLNDFFAKLRRGNPL